VQVTGWKLATMSEEDEEAAEKRWKEEVRETGHLGEECTEDDEEQEAEWYQEIRSNVLNAKAKHVRICAESKVWWNCAMKER